MSKLFLVLVLLVLMCTHTDAGEHPRVIVSSDIGGTDPDDFQSMVHLLVYADRLDLEGLISSPFGPGRREHILEVIDCYEKDFGNLKTYSARYPSPNALRKITKQGETESAPYRGYRRETEGSRWIVECARRDDPRPLHVLVWGGIEDLAQALHDAPDILSRLRVYYIGGPNKKWSADAYQYIAEHHRELWIIESNSTYGGWFVGGDQSSGWGNDEFVSSQVLSHGCLGDYFYSKLRSLKMGDTPSVVWLLHGDTDDPSKMSWGGRYVRAWERPFALFHGLPRVGDEMEVFGIAEFVLPQQSFGPSKVEAQLLVENQSLQGFTPGDGTIRFRFCPKAATAYSLKIRSNDPMLDGLVGAIKASAPKHSASSRPSKRFPNWWTDDPDPNLAEGVHFGAKTINLFRKEYLADFAAMMDRCTSPKLPTGVSR